jgi:uncharacterized membrane protein
MKQNKKTIIICITILVSTFTMGVFLGERYNLAEQTPASINVAISFFISIIALVFAMITYFSIDALDKKK